MTRRKKRGKKHIVFVIKLISLLTGAVILLYAFDALITSPLRSIAVYRAQQIASEIINNAVTDAIDQCGYSYSDLASIQRNDANNITSIEANTVNIARLQSAVTANIISDMKSIEDMTEKIYISSLLGPGILSGIGPSFSMRFSLDGCVNSSITSEFTSAGINQTTHTITIATQIKFISIIAGKGVETSVPGDFIAAQTVIVGNIPEYYTQIITQDSELINALDAYDSGKK